MKIAAVTTVKNEADVLELFVRINARWATHFFISDDASDDASMQILEALQREGFPVSVFQHESLDHQHDVVINRLMRAVAATDKFDYIFPIDADEFVFEHELLVNSLGELDADVSGHLEWRTMVPRDGNYFDHASPIHSNFSFRSREARQYSKIILPTEVAVNASVTMGNHLAIADGHLVPCRTLPCKLAHAPVRSREQVISKAIIGSHKMSVKATRGPDECSHWDMMLEFMRERNFRLSDGDLREIAFRYCLGPEHEVDFRTVDAVMGLPTDTVVYRDLQLAHPFQTLDGFLADLCRRIRKLSHIEERAPTS